MQAYTFQSIRLHINLPLEISVLYSINLHYLKGASLYPNDRHHTTERTNVQIFDFSRIFVRLAIIIGRMPSNDEQSLAL